MLSARLAGTKQPIHPAHRLDVLERDAVQVHVGRRELSVAEQVSDRRRRHAHRTRYCPRESARAPLDALKKWAM